MKKIDWIEDWYEEEDGYEYELRRIYEFYKDKKIISVQSQKWDYANYWRSQEYSIVKKNPDVFKEEYKKLVNNIHFKSL